MNVTLKQANTAQSWIDSLLDNLRSTQTPWLQKPPLFVACSVHKGVCQKCIISYHMLVPYKND